MLNLSHHLVSQAVVEAGGVARQTARLGSSRGVRGQKLSLNDPGMVSAATGRPGLFLQTSQRGRIIQRSPNLGTAALPLAPPLPRVLKWGGLPLWGTFIPTAFVHRLPVAYARVPVVQRGQVIGFVEAGVSLAPALTSVNTVGRGLLRVGAAVLAITSFLSAAFVYRTFGRVRRLNRMIGQIDSAQDLAQRVSVRGPRDEVRELAQVFNHMLTRLEKSFEGQQLITAQASHQLRTPLATAIGYAAMLRHWGQSDPDLVAEGVDAIHEQLERLQRTIDVVLRLAELDQQAPRTVSATPLSKFLETWRLHSPASIRLGGDPRVMVALDPEMMAEVLNILTDNALSHAGPRASITIGWRVDSKDWALIIFQDDGPGFAADLLPHLFQPFVKDARSSGTGLGLALARALVERQGGRIAADGAAMRGARILISLSLIS